MEVGISNFQQEVIDSSARQPVVVDFWAPWCAPCRALTPVLEKLEREYAGRIKLVKINVDENQELAEALQVRSIPAVFAFRDGEARRQLLTLFTLAAREPDLVSEYRRKLATALY